MLLATHTLIVPCVELTLADLDEDGGLVWDDKFVGIASLLAGIRPNPYMYINSPG